MNGGKDIKIGDDKRKVSIVPQDEQPLYNINDGKPLVDEFGFPLTTEVDAIFLPDASKERSTSVTFSTVVGKYLKLSEDNVAITTATYSSGNTNLVGIITSNLNIGDIIVGSYIPESTIISRIGIGSVYISNFTTNLVSTQEIVKIQRKKQTTVKSNPVWKVEEQFPEKSEVSTTLLGIDRQEVQLSLFSNVSSYGLDNDDFEYYVFRASNTFASWENRESEFYGPRYQGEITEETQESGIKITAFPTPYTYPFGPEFQKIGLYNKTLFDQYINFIDAGNKLYDYYDTGAGSGYPSTWKQKFLSKSFATLDDDDVAYVAGITTAFAQIDIWTETWKDILTNNLTDPVTGTTFGVSNVQNIIGSTFTRDTTRPGYSNESQRYVYLQSRKVFRYQPGRISGFTFGVRATPVRVAGVALEWGISNPTDQYVFRVDSQNIFSIVRRSTIPLSPSVLTRNKLTSDDQTLQTSGDPFDPNQYYTVVISRDKFNGDPLTGNGPSGYSLNIDKVTMYKIEFGWYGAIGARFYAYIPTDNGDARWVVLHTLVIENSLDQPCLRDSYFRFKYSVNIPNTADVRVPYYVYKYGASYYIDGGDEGTTQIYSASSRQVGINTTKNKTLIGIKPKDFIFNNAGIGIQNKKIIFPTELNLSSDSLSEIKIVSCSACPGFGHVYTPGLATTESGRILEIQFLNSNTIAAIGTDFSSSDIGAKIIAPSIYNAYIYDIVNPDPVTGAGQSAVVRGANRNVNRNLGGSKVLDRFTGITTTISNGAYPYPVRLSNFNSYAASDFKFTGSKIEIQFVNPGAGDEYGHFADFLIGVTNNQPDISEPDILNGFIINDTTNTVLPNENILYGMHRQSRQDINESGVEINEAWTPRQPSIPMGIDYRIPTLANPAGGHCCKLTVSVSNPIGINGIREYNINPKTGDSEGKYYLQIQGQFPTYDYNNGQIAIQSVSGITTYNSKFVGVVSTYSQIVSGVTTQYSYIEISETLNLIPSGSNFSSPFILALRPVNIKSTNGDVDSTKIFNYNPFPLYLVAKLQDNAQINNISVRETIGDNQRTISPRWYVYENTEITDANGKADKLGSAPTNFKDNYRLSSALIDNQNQQELRPYLEKDTLYVGANSTNIIDLRKIFGPDRTVITPDNNNLEAFFITAKKIDSGETGIIQASINYKEQ
jgi:hypothetical protein